MTFGNPKFHAGSRGWSEAERGCESGRTKKRGRKWTIFGAAKRAEKREQISPPFHAFGGQIVGFLRGAFPIYGSLAHSTLGRLIVENVSPWRDHDDNCPPSSRWPERKKKRKGEQKLTNSGLPEIRVFFTHDCEGKKKKWKQRMQSRHNWDSDSYVRAFSSCIPESGEETCVRTLRCVFGFWRISLFSVRVGQSLVGLAVPTVPTVAATPTLGQSGPKWAVRPAWSLWLSGQLRQMVLTCLFLILIFNSRNLLCIFSLISGHPKHHFRLINPKTTNSRIPFWIRVPISPRKSFNHLCAIWTGSSE